MSTPPPPRRAPHPSRPGFLRRAVIEAQRYGEDPWIFVRELLQNARDAGATKVELQLEESDGQTKLRCTDNGHGMAFADAKNYLFSLYSSSKENQGDQAGRFGVGFWSILRFEPDTITIRSSPQQDTAGQSLAWGIQFDGQLKRARNTSPGQANGTEVILERKQRDGQDAQRLFDAASQNARFLMQRDDPRKPLEITVNGESIVRPFSLPAPCVQFRAQGIRGVVALGQTPGVELFSRGLRVRAAANLEDLLSSAHVATQSRVRFHELSDALAPRAILDCENLDLLLYRSDVRDDGSLRKLIRLAQGHLRQLVEEQLALVHPPGLWERIESLWYRIQDRPHLGRWLGGTAAAAGILALVWGSGHLLQEKIARIEAQVPSFVQPQRPASPPVAGHLPHLRSVYRGPSVQTLDESSSNSLDVSYTPESTNLYLRQFSVSNLQSGQPSTPKIQRPYRGQSCKKPELCIQIEIPVRSRPGDTGSTRATRDRLQRHWVSLPEATGYRVNPKSVELIYRDLAQGPAPSFRLLSDSAQEPWLSLSAPFSGYIRYQMAPGPAPQDPQARRRIKHPDVESWSKELSKGRSKKDPRLIDDLERSVASRIRYSTDAQTASEHQHAIENKQPLIERALAIGAGDCDVQNSLLAMLLRNLGYPARLAVGYVGQNGGLVDTLHAWVEYRRTRNEPWRVLDASTVHELPRSLPTEIALAQNKAQQGPENKASSAKVVEAAPGDPSTAPQKEPTSEIDPEFDASDIDNKLSSLTDGMDDKQARTPHESEITELEDPDPLDFAAPQAEAQLTLSPAPGWISSLFALVDTYSWYWMTASVLLLLSGLALRLRRPSSNRIRLANAQHLPAIVQGALRQPESFYQLPGLFRRRLLQAHDGKLYSLSQAESKAAQGRLHVASSCHSLAKHTMGLGDIVLDTSSEISKTVAQTLNAHNLDPWQTQLENAPQTSVFEELNQIFANYRFPVWVGLSADLPQEVVVASLGQELLCPPRWASWLKARRQGTLHCARQLVFVSSRHPQWLLIQSIAEENPAMARFEAFVWIRPHLQTDDALVEALSSRLASEVLRSRLGRNPKREIQG